MKVFLLPSCSCFSVQYVAARLQAVVPAVHRSVIKLSYLFNNKVMSLFVVNIGITSHSRK